MTKNIKFVITRFVFFSSSKCTKIRFRPGLGPEPRWGSLRRSPRPLVGWGGDTSSPYPSPLDAFGVSNSAPRRLGSQAPSTQNPGYAAYIHNWSIYCRSTIQESAGIQLFSLFACGNAAVESTSPRSVPTEFFHACIHERDYTGDADDAGDLGIQRLRILMAEWLMAVFRVISDTFLRKSLSACSGSEVSFLSSVVIINDSSSVGENQWF